MSDAIAITHAIKDKVYSPKEVVQYYINQLKKYNEMYNVLADERFDEALEDAKHVDIHRPFAGVPILTKDLHQSVKGLKSSQGSKLLKDNIALKDDCFVQRLKQLGFIILASTSVPEFGLKYVSDSQLYGTVHNPLNPYFHAGGSSGGAASAVKANLIPLATASDAGGSIRVPASFCGLAGLKPSRGAMPIGPLRWRAWQGAGTSFALTSSVRDMKLLYYHLQAQQIESPFKAQRQSYAHLYESPLQAPLKMAYSLTDYKGHAYGRDAQEAILEAVELLRSLGHIVEEVTFPFQSREDLLLMYGRLMASETAASFTSIEEKRGRAVQVGEVEASSYVIARYGITIPAYQLSLDINQWDQLAAKACQFFTDYDAFIYPSTSVTAPASQEKFPNEKLLTGISYDALSNDDYIRLGKEAIRQITSLSPQAYLANMTGLPAISLPLYKNAESHMPIGVEFMAGKNKDNLLLLLAESLEPYFKK
ncbi:amidase family protein [Atopobacter sp. AH10]|uniref:amidase family protein n=1 Tax=Atopobacter sp. AH10 TaxID=2315861 RepID=UPI0013146543|nr:amidase family protein [Atopobacter sp. AH10]